MLEFCPAANPSGLGFARMPPRSSPAHHGSIVPLSAPPVARTPMHTRRLEYQAYERDDGLWDIEARLIDVKPFDCPLESGRAARRHADPRHVGPHHHRCTISTIIAAEAAQQRSRVPRLLRSHQSGLFEARRAESPEELSPPGRRALRRRRRLHATSPKCSACFPPRRSSRSIASRSTTATKPFQLDHCHAFEYDRRGAAVLSALVCAAG